MRKILLLPLLSFVIGSFASAENFECSLEADSTVEVKMEPTDIGLTVQISDPANFLEIRELELNPNFELVPLKRKKESEYKFAKYHTELNAWQDLTISIPKKLIRNTFKGFLTIYHDTGNEMSPLPSHKMNCTR